ncbi:MAG TPA: histidine kinase [Flexivirga sp.]|uniref:sensor histidine kinase n=1 Tax=Flexivirga sp. TaxID=1962927 RepID=UPI002C4367E0|nr:histidine kinase [Flexivirga sp.]HWC24094.1 histidine kinase [Flexivirga sp.]
MPQIWEQGRPTRRQLIFDLTSAAAFALLIGVVYAQVDLAQLGVVLVLAAALAVRRLSLPAMVLLGTVAAVIQFANPSWSVQLFVADVAYAALFFVLGAHPRLPVRRFGAIAAGTGCAILLVWMATLVDTGSSMKSRVFAAVAVTAVAALVCGGGWMGGYLRLQRRRSIQAELDRIERRRLAESYEHELQRSRIAADMHDIVAHSWAVVAAQADGARYTLRASPDAAEQALEVIAETARSTIADLRTILAELRDNDAERSTPGYEQHERLMQRMRLTGMQIQDERIGQAPNSSLIALTAYRLLSESLTNALKHGDLREPVRVQQDWTSGYRLRVVNVIGTPGDGTGHGIVGMMERAAISGGHLESRQRGRDWVVDCAIPDPQRSDIHAEHDAKESADT